MKTIGFFISLSLSTSAFGAPVKTSAKGGVAPAGAGLVKELKTTGPITEISFEFFKTPVKPNSTEEPPDKVSCTFKIKDIPKALVHLKALPSKEAAPDSALGEAVTVVYKSGQRREFQLLARTVLEEVGVKQRRFFKALKPLDPALCPR